MNGDSFITTGEVLISNYAVQEDVKNGKNSKVVADIDWTFPLDMVEIVWGDGVNTGRQVIPTADLPPFGTHHFEIPFDAKGKKWIRFAAWDSASEGAMTQPQRLSAGEAARAAATAQRRRGRPGGDGGQGSQGGQERKAGQEVGPCDPLLPGGGETAAR